MPLGGHAVAAAEAAAIGHREAQVADRPAVAVEQLRAFARYSDDSDMASRIVLAGGRGSRLGRRRRRPRSSPDGR